MIGNNFILFAFVPKQKEKNYYANWNKYNRNNDSIFCC